MAADACVVCGTGSSCLGGVCVATCSPQGCPNGCCSGNTCIPSSSAACGINGQQCLTCSSSQACQNGACVTATCGLTTCPGCCRNNTCVSPVIPSACGFSGNSCSNCAQGQACSGGLCSSAPTTTYAGSPCAQNADCTIGGVFGACNTAAAGWPGGYCQDTCVVLGCNGTDVCLSQNCWERCPDPRAGQSTCRLGYVCGGLVQTDGGAITYGICKPDCHLPGAGCTSGTCSALGYCI